MPSTDTMWEHMMWVHENGSYVLHNDEGLVVLRTKEPTVLFNKRSGQMIRCGDRDRLEKYLAKMRADLIAIDDLKTAKDIVLFTSRRISIAELNLCMGEPGYCRLLWKRIQVQ